MNKELKKIYMDYCLTINPSKVCFHLKHEKVFFN